MGMTRVLRETKITEIEAANISRAKRQKNNGSEQVASPITASSRKINDLSRLFLFVRAGGELLRARSTLLHFVIK